MTENNNIQSPPAGDRPVRAVNAGKPANPYVEVALTYVRRMSQFVPAITCGPLVLLLVVGGSMLFVGIWCGHIEFLPDFILAVLRGLFIAASSVVCNVRISLVLVMLLSFAFAVHLREQFADAQARLVPRFGRVHITVAAVVLLIIAIVVPAYLAWSSGSNPTGFLAMTVFGSGTLLWAGSFRRMGWLAAVAFYVCIAHSSDDGVRWINRAFGELISGRAAGAAALLLGLGGLMIFLTWRRLVRFNEEMFGYDRPVQTGSGVRIQIVGPGWQWGARFLRRLEGLNEEREMARVVRHARGASASPWSRVFRWQAGMVANRPAWLCVIVAVLAAQLLMSAINGGAKRDSMPLLVTSLSLLIMTPIVPLAHLFERTRMIRYELLMPVERGKYLRQLGLAILLAQFQWWSAACSATLVWWVITGRQSASLIIIAGAMGISALLQVSLFGMAIWMARYPLLSLGLPLLLFVAPILAAMMAAHAPWIFDRPYAACWAGAALLAVTSVLVIYAAYRRWLVADFD